MKLSTLALALFLAACGGGGDPYYAVPKCDDAALAKPGGGVPACPTTAEKS